MLALILRKQSAKARRMKGQLFENRTAEQMVKLKDPQLLATFNLHQIKYVLSSEVVLQLIVA